jgi:hypothetical protein
MDLKVAGPQELVLLEGHIQWLLLEVLSVLVDALKLLMAEGGPSFEGVAVEGLHSTCRVGLGRERGRGA